jgi:hypothetical protein
MAGTFLVRKISEGKPLTVNGWTLVPLSQALVIQLPGWRGGLVWNRPLGVWASRDGGQEHFLPVRDPTRTAILAMLAGAISFLLVMGLIRRRGWR